MRIYDAHCHLGKGLDYSVTAESLLQKMDACGVERAVVVPADRQIAVRNQEGNDAVLAAMREHPDRLTAFCTANPWFGEESVAEIRRAFDAGAAGLKLHPVLQGFSIIDPVARPVIEAAVGLGKPVYFHTGTPVGSTPFQLEELCLRYPEGRFIMGHAAYSDYWNDVVFAVQGAENMFVETSTHLPVVIRLLVEAVGTKRVIYGSNHPLNSMSLEIEKITRYITAPADLERVFSANLDRLLEGGPR
jgi:predicted TIM-barrel fold metal-dependent hydrolase